MAFSIKKFSSIVSDMIAWLIAHQSKLTDFNEGSVIRSLVEAIALEIEQLYIKTRVGYGRELKQVPFYAFQFVRQSGTKASGEIVFTRTGTSGTLTIPVGSLVATTDGTQYTTTEIGTISPGNTASNSVSITAVKEGREGNVPAATIVTIITPLSGIDSVTNAAGTTGGLDEETDTELLKRFQEYIEGLGLSNVSGLIAGAKSVEGVRSASVVEHFPPVANVNVTVYIDDGAGNASSDLIDDVEFVLIGDGTAANPGYKAAGVNVAVVAPSKVTITVAIELADDGSIDHSTIEFLVKETIQDYINNLWIGEDVIINRIIDFVMEISGITDLILTTPASNTSIGGNQIARIAASDIAITWST